MRARLSIVCGGLFAVSAALAGAAYIALLPRIIAYSLERRATACVQPTQRCAPPGLFLHKRALPAPNDRLFASPNDDVLPSAAWLDLRQTAYVLHLPDMGERYYSFQFLDAWTNAFGLVSRRIFGGGANDYLIVGPDWQGVAPAAVKAVFRADHYDVWVTGRIEANGENDLEAATALQDEIALKPF